MNKISIVILNWNGKKYLEQFMPFVIKYSNVPGAEIVVADNASSDGSVEFIQLNYPQTKLIKLDRNLGFALGYNESIKQLNAEYYVLLNSDVEVSENWIQPFIDLMDSNPDVGACMPKLLGYDDRSSFEYSGAAGGFIDKYGYPFCRGRVFTTIEKDLGQYNDACNVFWATGACMFLRAEAFRKAGGFDAEFFAHMEEIDLCWRMKWQGYKIVILPQIEVFHIGGGALPKENPQKTYLNFRNNLYLLYKNLPSDKLYKILIIRFLLDYLAAIYYIVNFQLKFFHAIIRAHINFCAKLSYLKLYRKSTSFLQKNENPFSEVLNKSVVVEYFIKKKKTFTKIIN